MRFKTPKDVLDTISAGDKTNQIRSDNRAKVALEGEQYKGQADGLARAITRLGERERVLRMQPLPGSMRPTSSRTARPAFQPPPDA